MRVVVQRVSKASVSIHNKIHSSIGAGLLVFVGIEDADNSIDITWLSHKLVNLRIFDDGHNIPNLSVKDTGANILLISQFTLHALTKKGNRPAYSKAAGAAKAIPIYEKFILQLEKDMGKNIFTGIFGADMKVELLNDGPVTIWIDTKNRE